MKLVIVFVISTQAEEDSEEKQTATYDEWMKS